MSKTGEEEEDDEFFHDSLDRLLSSANTSCSGSPSSSESEDPNPFSNRGSPNYADGLSDLAVRVVPKFPKCVSDNYDVWISQPSSVEERRLRLLRQMGLSSDPSLVRHRPTSSAVFDSNGLPDLFGRLVSSDQLNYRNPGEGFSKTSLNSNNNNNNNADNNGCDDNSFNVSGIVRSKSDGQYKSPGILSVNSGSSQSAMANAVGNGGDVIVNNNQVNNNQRKSQSHNVVLIVDKLANGLLNKPPKGKITMDSTRNGSCNSLSGLGNGEVAEGLECNGLVRIDDPENPVCTIKNLDNGKEFVVNEVREDGMWNKLKEVGTGRQLTMEEFEMSVGASPIVQELMRRQSVENGNRDTVDLNVENGHNGSGSKFNKKGSWLKSIRNVANSVTGHKERRSSDERDTSSDRGGRRSSSATDDSQDASFHGPERVRVRQYGKSQKELTMLYKSQEIQAHKGSIWTIKFSLDGKYLASAGEDCIIHVWQVVESERKGDLLFDKPEDGNLNLLFLANGSPEPGLLSPNLDGHSDKRRRGRSSISRKSLSLEHVLVPETIFALAEKPYCSFQGHLDDVLDLSWSKSQHLLSSSMDKTVRLWHLSSNSCLKTFSHNDYVTCIHFNPVDDRYFISGSLDGKVRIWSIPEHKVVDWYDLHEMVTAACYTPDGQGALVGSYKGSCHLYNTSDNKLQQRSQINLQNKKKKSHQKKITGFQFAPGSTSEVLVTSADSRIRVIDGVDLVHKFKGFRNTNSQISASLTANGKYIVCASEDSHVFVWRHEGDSWPSRSKGVTVTQSYEHFHSQDVSAAIPWPGVCEAWGFQDTSSREQSGPIDQSDEVFTANHPPTPVEETNGSEHSPFASGCSNSPLYGTISTASNSYFFDRISATWPEEKLTLAAKNRSPRVSVDFFNGINCTSSAWGMVIVTAGLRGEIRTFQNFGLPVRI